MTSMQANAARILLVEDEAVIAMATEALLEELGHTVVGCAASGDEAEAIAAAERPDLALMDINIKGDRSGVVVAASLTERFDIPSIFVTAYSDAQTVAEAATSVPLGYLVKPYDRRELAAAIQVALYRARRDAELARYRQELEEKNAALEAALADIKVLSGLVPVCAWCKDVRNDDGYWESVYEYLARESTLQISHGICPNCAARESADIDD
jgi:CheY-like chemotaxis protein